MDIMLYKSLQVQRQCIPSNLKLTSFFKISAASLSLLVLSVTGSPKLNEIEKQLLDQNQSLTTLAADFAISASCFASGIQLLKYRK